MPPASFPDFCLMWEPPIQQTIGILLYTVPSKFHLQSNFCTHSLWRLTALQNREEISSRIPLHSFHNLGHNFWSLLSSPLQWPFSEGSHILESHWQLSLQVSFVTYFLRSGSFSRSEFHRQTKNRILANYSFWLEKNACAWGRHQPNIQHFSQTVHGLPYGIL